MHHGKGPEHCRLCFLFHTDARYRAAWGGTATLPAKSHEEIRAAKPRVSKGCGNCHKPKSVEKSAAIEFERVVVVNLKRRTDRLASFKAGITDWPFRAYEVFEAVDASKLPAPNGWKGGGGAWGCLQSHRGILERSILDGVKSILVLEDDAEPVPGLTAAWQRFQSNVPGDWEMLLLGGQHRVPGQKVADGVVKCFNTVRTHAYALRGAMLRDMYAFWCGVGIDTHLDNLAGPTYAQRKVYAPEPFLFIQGASRSDITGREEPPRSWSKPSGDERLLYLTCSREEIDKRRESGEIHTGYDRDPATGVDRGLVKMFAAGKPSSPALRKWVEELQSEAVASGRTLAFWYPGVDATEVVRAAWRNVETEKAPEYHSEAAFKQRMAARPKPVDGHAFFYHVACLNGWEPIVEEQLRLCAHVGIKTIHCGVLSDHAQLAALLAMGEKFGIELKIVVHREELWHFERLTLDCVYAYAVEHPTHAVCYFHTKGVSAPGDDSKRVWRRAMMREVVARWERNLDSCATHDLVGAAWQCSPEVPHFSGNFWFARCDWIASIGSCTSHRDSRPDFSFCGQSWRSRFFCETWVGSRPYHHVSSLGGFDTRIWEGGMPIDVPGFSW